MKETTISLDEDPTLGSDLTLCQDFPGSNESNRNIPILEVQKSETPVASDQPEETRAKFLHQNSVTSLLQEISDLNGEVFTALVYYSPYFFHFQGYNPVCTS